MPIRDSKWPAGTPCWVDVAVPDVDAAAAFYGAVIGWTFHDSGAEYGNYRMCMAGEQTAAGLGKIQMEGQPAAWTVYLASDDADATVQAVKDNGGAVLLEPMDIPQVGRMAIAADPTGAVFGVWQAAPMPGIEIYNETGGLVWEDARLTDLDAGKAFYAAVFGFEYNPVPGGPDDYGVFGFDHGDPLGGSAGRWARRRGRPAIGSRTSGSRTSTPRSRPGRTAAARWSRRRWTARSVGWPRWSTRSVPCSPSTPRFRADPGGRRTPAPRCVTRVRPGVDWSRRQGRPI